jgi:hypothetical protein
MKREEARVPAVGEAAIGAGTSVGWRVKFGFQKSNLDAERIQPNLNQFKYLFST